VPELTDFLPGLGTLLVAVVLVWFALGTQLNVRKGERTMKWLQAGLPLLGPRTTLRWLGSTVAELTIVQPRAPLRSAVVMIVLEPRDLAALWSLFRVRGRRDFLLLRCDLQRAPRSRVDLIDPRAWTARDRRRDDAPFRTEDSWVDARGASVQVRYDDAADAGRLRPLWDRLTAATGGAWRVSVRPLVPHLEVHTLLPRPEAHDAHAVLTVVRELAEAVGAGR
jgi:hypothetical protein